jgi:Nucleotide-diphospho-sugar transferase
MHYNQPNGGMTDGQTEGPDATNCGVLYIATGPKYVREALASIRSVRSVMPWLAITLMADAVPEAPDAVDVRIIPNAAFGFRDKVKYIDASPYEKTLFIDTDTYVCGDLSECFDLLDHFDLLVAHDALRVTTPNPGIGLAFPELNTGVIFYRKCEATGRFFANWWRVHEAASAANPRRFPDQVSFREVLLNSGLRIHVLPPEYHCMVWQASYVYGPVKILHGRQDFPLHEVAREVNAATGPRIFKAGLGCQRIGYKTDILHWAGRVVVAQAMECLSLPLRRLFPRR